MLAIRLRRTGRKGHAQFRVIVQDSRFSPSSGRVVAYLGSYDPHAKTAVLDKEKITNYLTNGAQPSGRAAGLFKSEGITLPNWVKEAQPKKRAIRHPEKLRRNRPPEEAAPPVPAAEAPEETAETPSEETPETDTPAAETTEAPAENNVDESPDPASEPAAEEAPSADEISPAAESDSAVASDQPEE
jgi:small subunit ribosomal protein S16